MKNLENYGVQELGAKEIQSIDGGLAVVDDILIGLVVGAVLGIVNDWDDFKEGFFSAFN